MPQDSDQRQRRPFGTPVDANLDGIPDEAGVDTDGDGRVDFRAPVISFRGEHFVHVGSSRPRNLRTLMNDASIESTWRTRAIIACLLIGFGMFWTGWYARAATYGAAPMLVAAPLPESKLAGEVEDAIRGAPYSWIAGLDPREQRKLLDAWKADRQTRKEWEEKHGSPPRK